MLKLARPLRIFCIYAREDEALLHELNRHLAPLKRSGLIETWSDQDISAGSEWEREIASRLNSADIILVLVSPDFMVSDYAYSREMTRAMERSENKEARVIPVILRPVAGLSYTPFGKLQSLPKDAKPVIMWTNPNAAFLDIVRGIREVVNELQESLAAQVQWVDEGNRFMQLQQFENALDAYEQAIRLEPTNPTAYIGKGYVLLILRRYAEALDGYEQAIRLDPTNDTAYIGRGITLRLLGRFTEALASYDQALRLAPNNHVVHLERGKVLYGLQRYEEALAAYDQALQLSPENAIAYINKGTILRSLSRYEQALVAYTQALQLAPDNIEVYLYLGDVLLQLQRYEDAVQAYMRVLTLDPKNVPAYLSMGDAFLRLHLYSKALEAYNAVIMFDPNNARAYYAKATILSKLGQYDEALLAAEQAKKLGFNVEDNLAFYGEIAGVVTAQPPDVRIEFVQQFLTNAGFDFRSLPNGVGFLAIARTPLWRLRFPRGVYVRVLFDSPLDQRTVQSIYRDSRQHSDHALVIINQQPELSGWGEINILRGEPEPRRFICLPIDESLIRKGIASNDEPRTLKSYIDKHLGKGFDPYDMRDPVSGAVSFFGRQRLTEELLDALQSGQRVGLFGIHKMGKSSVLRELQKRAEFPVAYVYLETGDDLARIYSRVIDDWVRSGRVKCPDFNWTRPQSVAGTVSQSSFNAVAKNILAYLNTMVGIQPLLGIFLDEIEHIVPAEGEEKTLQLYVSLMDSLRGLQQETNSLALLVAGVHPSIARRNYFWSNQKNPMHQVIVEQFLPPLDRQDCSNMIRSLGQQINLQYEERALEYILDMSGSHPFLARQICSLAYKKSRGMRTITIEMVEVVVQDFVRRPSTASYFDENGLWKELGQPDLWGEEIGKANHQLLCTLASSDQDLSENELCAGIDKKVALQAFDALQERSIISSPDNSGYYRITFGLFRNWIRFHQLGIE
jgi:tetratricopeptide (TPR) repeat protein